LSAEGLIFHEYCKGSVLSLHALELVYKTNKCRKL